MSQTRQLPKGLILGGYVNGLGLVRSLARIGISSIVLDTQKSIAGASRTAKEYLCPHPIEDPEEFLAFIKSICSQQIEKPVVFATNDIWLFPILERKEELEDFIRYPMSDWSIIGKCLNKESMGRLAKDNAIPHPISFFPKTTHQLRQLKNEIAYPSILKPVITVDFSEALGWTGKNVVLQDANHIERIATELDQAGLSERDLVIQELIPGGVNNLYTYTSYSNIDGKVLAWSIGHKIRQYPPEAGTITSGKVTPNSQLAEIGKRFIESIKFHGIANTEFKLDSRDGSFKLIEINARPGMWNLSALESGVNLPALAFNEAIGEPVKFVGTSPKELIWANTLDDLHKSVFLNKRQNNEEYHLSLSNWRDSLKGEKVDAIASMKDPLPMLSYVIYMIANSSLVKRWI